MAMSTPVSGGVCHP